MSKAKQIGMGKSLKLITLFGIPVKVHWSFFLLFFYVLYIGVSNDMSVLSIALYSALILTLFVCVVLHEFGHALMARRFNSETQDIIISPIGGLARLTSIPEKPKHELLVAIAGPLVNVGIAAILAIGIFFLHPVGFELEGEVIDDVFSNSSNFPFLLMGMNLGLFAFNLLPAFPMDGGRIFRSFLAFWMERHKATRIAGIVGQIFAVGFIIWGIYWGHYILPLIGVFIFFGAGGESKSTKLQYLLKQAKVRDIVRRNFTPIHTYDFMQTPIDALKHNNEKSFLVFNPEEILIGVIIAPAMDFVFKENKIHDEVLKYMHPLPAAVSPSLSLKELYEMMTKQKLFIIPVIEDGQLVGLVDREQLQNWINLSMPQSRMQRLIQSKK